MAVTDSPFFLLALARWQILRNSLRVKSKRLELAARIVVGVVVGIVAVGFGLTMGAAAFVALYRGRPSGIAVLLWVVFGAWQLMPLLVEASSPALNFRELARYPISFRLYYLMNTAYGLLDPAAVLSVIWLFCIWAGIALARPGWAARAALFLALFALVNLLLNRVVFGFLERALSTRRGREAFLGLGLVAIVLTQAVFYAVLPQLERGTILRTLHVLRPIAPFLPPSVVSGGVQGAAGAAPLLAMAAWIVIPALVLRRQLRRNYLGEFPSEAPAIRGAVQVQPGWAVPLADNAFAAILEKEFRYAVRDARTLLSFAMAPLSAALYLASSELVRKSFDWLQSPSETIHLWLALYALVNMGTLAFNCFCYDSYGFSRWLMAPVDLRRVVLAKNVIIGLLLVGNLVFITVLIAAGRGLSAWRVLEVTAGFVYAALAILALANLISVRFPMKIEYGTMSTKRTSSVAVLVSLFSEIAVIGSVLVVFHLAGRYHLDRLPLLIFSALVLLAARFYSFSLRSSAAYARHHSDEIASELA